MNAKMKKTAASTGKWINDNRKPLLIAAGVILAIALTIWVGKKIFSWVSGKINETKIINDSEDHTGTNVTSTLQFKSLAVRIYDAVYRFGTNEAEIYNVFNELRTQADWECLKRTWNSFFNSLPNITRAGLLLGGTWPSLIGTMQHELTQSELQHCREILQSHNIVPDF